MEDDHVLTCNLGIPIIVACCKTDVIPSLSRDFHFGDDEFEYIQQALRRICIKCLCFLSFPFHLLSHFLP